MFSYYILSTYTTYIVHSRNRPDLLLHHQIFFSCIVTLVSLVIHIRRSVSCLYICLHYLFTFFRRFFCLFKIRLIARLFTEQNCFGLALVMDRTIRTNSVNQSKLFASFFFFFEKKRFVSISIIDLSLPFNRLEMTLIASGFWSMQRTNFAGICTMKKNQIKFQCNIT